MSIGGWSRMRSGAVEFFLCCEGNRCRFGMTALSVNSNLGRDAGADGEVRRDTVAAQLGPLSSATRCLVSLSCQEMSWNIPFVIEYQIQRPNR